VPDLKLEASTHMRTTPWPVLAGVSLALLVASTAAAEGLPSSAAIGNGVLAIGVRSDGGLAPGGPGVQFTPTGADGLPSACACDASLSVGSTLLSESVESFTYTATTATSTVIASDAVSGTQLRMTQDFHPSPVAPNLYELLVTVENQSSTPVQPTYERGLSWLSPIPEYQLALPLLAPGAVEQFRLYIGAGASLEEAMSGFAPADAALVAQLPGATTFVFGYASGATPAVAAGSGGGGTSSGSGPARSPSASGPTGQTPKVPSDKPVTNGAPSSSDDLVTNNTPSLNTPSNASSSYTPPNGGDIPKPIIDVAPPSAIDPLPGLQPAATPELDSLALMGSGLSAFGLYALNRWRARRR
jgi:hypothetical protein